MCTDLTHLLKKKKVQIDWQQKCKFILYTRRLPWKDRKRVIAKTKKKAEITTWYQTKYNSD